MGESLQIIKEFLKARKGQQVEGSKYYKREWGNGRWKYWYSKAAYDKSHPTKFSVVNNKKDDEIVSSLNVPKENLALSNRGGRNEEPPEKPPVISGSASESNDRESFEDFIKNALSVKSGFKRRYIKKISKEEEDILEKIGVNANEVKLYKHSIDHDTVRKIIKDHGNASTEIPRGQLPVTSEDIEKIPEILILPDKIELLSGFSKTGLNLIRYEKRIDDILIVVEEVRTGSKELAVKTMYKRRVGGRANDVVPENNPSPSSGNVPPLPKFKNITKEKTSQDENTKKSNEIRKIKEKIEEKKKEQVSKRVKNAPASEITTIEQYTDKKHFNEKIISGIKDSILANGYDVAEPLKVDKGPDGKYRVVDGHHRFEAVSQLIKDGLLPNDFSVPVVEEKYNSEADRLLAQVSANKNRREVERLDDAKAYDSLVKQGKTIQEIAQRTGESQEYVKGTIALNNLIPELKDLLRTDAKYNIRKKDDSNDGSKEKKESLNETIAIVLGRYGLNDDGTQNGTIQRKAFNWYSQNKSKGITPSQVKLYISSLKSQTFNFGSVDSSGKSDVEREAIKYSGGEDSAKAATVGFENLLKKIQQPIQKYLGDTVTSLNENSAKKLAASIIATKGESSLETELEKLSVVINSISAFRDSLKKKFSELKVDSMTPELLFKSKNAIFILEFLKGRKRSKANIGEIHTWSDGKKHKKNADGWSEVSEITAKKDNVGQVEEKIRNFVDECFSSSDNTAKEIVIKKIDKKEADFLKEKFGIIVTDGSHLLTKYEVIHILNSHGNERREKLRGQLPVKKEDFQKIPEIIGNPNRIYSVGKSHQGLETIRYEKAIKDLFFYVEEVRNKGNDFVPKTMFKQKGEVGDVTVGNSPRNSTSKTTSPSSISENTTKEKTSQAKTSQAIKEFSAKYKKKT